MAPKKRSGNSTSHNNTYFVIRDKSSHHFVVAHDQLTRNKKDNLKTGTRVTFTLPDDSSSRGEGIIISSGTR